MSIVFFDHLINFKNLDTFIKRNFDDHDERQELWLIIEEILHNRVIHICLHHLPKDDHLDFLDRMLASPNDKKIIDYIEEKVKKDMKKIIRDEIKKVELELKKEIKNKK